jgi:AhpD family alkylhydroperoxidase
MPYIPLEDHLPGITGLLEYRKDSGQPIRELTQILMRGLSSLTEGERELIAAVVSNGNQCKFCTTAHTAVADLLPGDQQTSQMAKHDINSAPVSEKMKGLNGGQMKATRISICTNHFMINSYIAIKQ